MVCFLALFSCLQCVCGAACACACELLCAQWVDVWRSIVRYVPIGLRKWFQSCGVENVEELNWWESAEFVKTVPSDDGACITSPSPAHAH